MTDDPRRTDDDMMDPGDQDEALAAEWVLGLLDDDQARATEQRRRSDPEFGRRVRGWHERLALLAGDLPDAFPAPHVKPAIDAALGLAVAPPAPIPAATAAPPPRRTVRAATRAPLRRGLWLTGVAAAAAIALAWVIMPGEEFRPDYHAAPANTQLAMRIDARIDSKTHVLDVQMTEGMPPTDGDLELWWIASADAAPLSLGVVPARGSLTVNLSPGMVPSSDVVLAVTAEPRGGSPTGQPTGPVLASAPITPV